MKQLRVPNHLRGDHVAQLAHFTLILTNGCWEFTGYVLPNGYGQLGRNTPAHRLAWEVANGRPVPGGLVVDHQCHNFDALCFADNLCRHRRCVNPAHLEAVPQRINIVRGKGFAGLNAAVECCPQGHPYDEVNTYYRPDRFGRMCRVCRYEAGRRQHDLHAEHIAAQARAFRRRTNPEGFAIREWAASVGLPCALHGPISRAVRAAYAADQAVRSAA
jgi:hypothetical protein